MAEGCISPTDAVRKNYSCEETPVEELKATESQYL